MRIIHLVAENYKRLVAIDVTPEGALIGVQGRNAQGKSSLLDAIYAALAGASAVPSKPIRKGEESARIQLELGDDKVMLVVRRTFTRREDDTVATSIIVENPDGARYASPQKLLDGLLGALAFDPLAFSRMAPTEQLAELRDMVPGVDFKALDEASKEDYELRRDVNRRAKATRAQLDALAVPGDPRQERVDESAIVAELNAAGETKAAIERERARRYKLKDDASAASIEIEVRENRIAEMKAQIAEYVKELAELRPKLEAQNAAITALPALAEPPNTAALVARIDAARKTNLVVTERERVLEQRAELERTITMLEKQANAFTTAIDSRERQKADAVAAAKLPIEGLGFAADGVLFNGLPFDQASDAEKLRASVAIAAAKNPKLRVIRIRDGSLLDDDGMRLLAEFAAEHSLQVWVERVANNAASGLVIEDGRLVAAKDAAA